jgi:glucosamine-6-phosphate deaminase
MVYEELVRMHKQRGLSFSNDYAFLDEYYPIAGMYKTIIIFQRSFDHIDIKAENINMTGPYID